MRPEDIYQGLLARNFPPVIAQGIMGNIAAESRYNPGINEIAPLVPGSRGGFGFMQWTGPRRRQLEAFAQERGQPVSDPNLQLDFLRWEVDNTERNAWARIQGATDPIDATRRFSEHFLRPGIPHMNSRIAETQRFIGGGAQGAAPQVASRAATETQGASTMPTGGLLGGAQQPAAQAQPAQGERERWYRDPAVWEALALGFNSMRLNPDPGLAGAVNARQARRSEEAEREAERAERSMTREQAVGYLQNNNAPDHLVQAVVQGLVPPEAAVQLTLQRMNPEDNRTALQQNYEYALSLGMDPEAARQWASSAPQTTINTGDNRPHVDSQGRALVQDENGEWIWTTPPGSAAEQDQAEAAAAAEAAQRNATDYARTVTQDIGIADDYLSQIGPIAGADNMFGANVRSARANIAGTPEYNMRQFVESSLSNVTLDTMNRMRESSPAGATGFGNMSERQMGVIRGVLGQWNPGLPIEDQRYILHRLGNFYMDVQFGSREERAAAVRDGRMTPEENAEIESLYYPETRDVRGRRLDDPPAAPTDPPSSGGRLRFNPETGEFE